MENRKTQGMTDQPVPARPLAAPDVDAIEPALLTLTSSSFVPPKVRATIYAAAGVIGVVCFAVGPAVGGLIGDILTGVGAGATALGSGVALSHIPR